MLWRNPRQWLARIVAACLVCGSCNRPLVKAFDSLEARDRHVTDLFTKRQPTQISRRQGTASSVSFNGTARLLPSSDPSSSNAQNTSNIPATPFSKTNLLYLPDFAITYAPVLYLATDELFWPSAIDYHLSKVVPWQGYTPYSTYPKRLTLANLNFSIDYNMYLSVDNITQSPYPDWWYSAYGKPDSSGYSGGNVSIIAVDKGASIAAGVVDIFYFLFYSWNQGDNVGGETFGNHLSDIEYVMIRFYSGKPRHVFLSQHADGVAYEYNAMQMEGQRPIAYVARGGHANYPIAAETTLIPSIIGLVYDTTSPGLRWDVTKNYNAYWYSTVSGWANAAGRNASTWPSGPPGYGYLQSVAKWGNKALPKNATGQMYIFGQYKWADGGTGPADGSKAIGRTWMCATSDCVANSSLPISSNKQAPGIATALSSNAVLQSHRCSVVLVVAFLGMLLAYAHVSEYGHC